MDLAYASRTGATSKTALYTTESVTVTVLTDVPDQLPMTVSTVLSTQSKMQT